MSAEHHPALAHHFENLDQQRAAGLLGMWAFLATEVLFFGGLFVGYTVFRLWYPQVFAEASRHLNIYLGTANTAILLGSSLTMALAVHGAHAGNQRQQVLFLGLTIFLGVAFLAIKAVEWHHDYEVRLIPVLAFNAEPWREANMNPQEVQLFFSIYFIMTGLHALHMIVGIGILAVLVALARRGRFSSEYYTPVEVSGLYWHFVDIIWIFLFPLFYLVGTRGTH